MERVLAWKLVLVGFSSLSIAVLARPPVDLIKKNNGKQSKSKSYKSKDLVFDDSANQNKNTENLAGQYKVIGDPTKGSKVSYGRNLPGYSQQKVLRLPKNSVVRVLGPSKKKLDWVSIETVKRNGRVQRAWLPIDELSELKGGQH